MYSSVHYAVPTPHISHLLEKDERRLKSVIDGVNAEVKAGF